MDGRKERRRRLVLWMAGFRWRTLPMAFLPVVTATVLARLQGFPRSADGWPRFWLLAAFCLLVSLNLQIGVNFLNDYSDGTRGRDEARKANREDGPVSGPVRLVASGVRPKAALAVAVGFLALACLSGLVVVTLTGLWALMAVGVVCLAAAWAYSSGRHPYGVAGWGEVAAFLFFGPVAVLGTDCVLGSPWPFCPPAGFVRSGSAQPVFTCTCIFAYVFTFLACLIPGLFSACLMMVNNLCDIDDDEFHGKRTLMVRWGRKRGEAVFAICLGALLLAQAGAFFLLVSSPFIPLIASGTHPLPPRSSLATMIVCCLTGLSIQSVMDVSLWLRLHRRDFRRALTLVSAAISFSAISFLPFAFLPLI